MKKSELIKLLKKYGCTLVREGGNHEIWANKDDERFSVSRTKKEVPMPVVMKILKQAGIKDAGDDSI
ncbi:type II toxin-antitoxin system HicA family toxin [Selenomonas artemidis]|nr:type II toxin-antitoxin system HicA family toxin [Selenomonas artemidis]